MRKIVVVIIALLCSIAAIADTKRADKLFDRWEYARAAQLYEKEAIDNPSALVYYKLGLCYMRMSNHAKAVAAFDKVHGKGKFSIPNFYMEYGQMLRANGRYPDAKEAFKKYMTLKPTDKRGRFFMEACDIAAVDHEDDLPVIVENAAPINSPYADLCPVLFKDGVVFTSACGKDKRTRIDGWSGDHYLGIYYSKRGGSYTDFDHLVPFLNKEIVNKYHDGPACFTPNEDTMYFSRVVRDLRGEEKRTIGVEKVKIYFGAIKNGKMGKLKEFPYNSDSFSVACPFISADGNRLYFASDRPGGYGETDIWYCRRTTDGWSKPINMGPKVNTFGKEKYPFEDKEGNVYFSSDGYQGFGGLDICVAEQVNGVLQKAVAMKQPINSPADDYGILTMDEGRRGYFTSNRAGGQGDDDIYYFDMADSLIRAKKYAIGKLRTAKPTPPPPEKEEEEEVAVKAPPVVTPPAPKPITPPPPPVKPKPVEEVVPDYEDLVIHFDLNKSDIRPEDFGKIDHVIEWLKKHPGKKLYINGHTDSRASEQYNDVLSRNRARAAADYMITKGVPGGRLVTKGFGYRQLINFCGKGIQCPESQQEENRRVEFKVN
jgi:outer membrane protein OmpA-like peptidoglycan-associated protein